MVLSVDDNVGYAVFRVQCAFWNMESETVLNVKIEKIGAVGDDVTRCYEGPLYIFLCRSAKYEVFIVTL